MTLSMSRHKADDRLGVDDCPGIDARGHGLTVGIIHDGTCCHEQESGRTSSPARAEAFREAAVRWGSAWPEPEPEAGS